ncbi:MAG: rhomboid family intramembrane serine protease [Sphingobacteriaceae bacterium]|nr:rhomboid family intramembrane serine protease [Sphingobacteriaceae bacterium]
MSYNDPYRPSGFGYLPVVTKNILIINVLFFLLTLVLQQTQHIDLTKYLGLHYFSAPDFRPHQFITYLFMHGGISHIVFNMLGVYIFGQVLEQVWGPKRFLIFYILTGLGAALAQYGIIHFSIGSFISELEAVQTNLTLETFTALVNSDEFQVNLYHTDGDFGYMQNFNEIMKDNPARALSLASQYLIDFKNSFLNSNVIIGASGSLFGLLGAFGMLFPNRLLYLYFFIPVKAKWLVIGYGALELFSGITNRAGDNVAHFAHLGGLFVGLILVLIWRRDRANFY